jgi:hypothetical protein
VNPIVEWPEQVAYFDDNLNAFAAGQGLLETHPLPTAH